MANVMGAARNQSPKPAYGPAYLWIHGTTIDVCCHLDSDTSDSTQINSSLSRVTAITDIATDQYDDISSIGGSSICKDTGILNTVFCRTFLTHVAARGLVTECLPMIFGSIVSGA